MTVLIIVPMLGRAHRVAPLTASIEANTPQPHRVLFVTSHRDVEVEAAVDAAGYERIGLPANHCGDYAIKINTAAARSDEPFIFTGADDLAFHPEWLPAALVEMNDTIGVVGTQDLCNPRVIAGVHATHFLIARWYVELGTIDEPGKVFHEGYPHECVDDELIGTARHRRAYQFAARSVVEHLHPLAGKAPPDDMYAQAPIRIRRGRQMFRTREHKWQST